MWLVVGLGNPDAKYRGTRHNVGFEVVDLLAERATTTLSEKKFKAQMAKARLGGTDVVLLEPQTYMNLSGESVGPALGFYKLGVEQVLVVHDELDLELGKCRLKKGGGHGALAPWTAGFDGCDALEDAAPGLDCGLNAPGCEA